MLTGFLILLICQLLGEFLVIGLGLPVPGPVAGMLILLSGLMLYGEVPKALRLPAEGLIRYLALLFIPAGVGLMLHLHILRAEWLVVAASLVGSTVLTLVVTALTLKFTSRSSSAVSSAITAPNEPSTDE